MYRCILSLANLSLWITTVASIVALFAPFWLSTLDNSKTEGLFMKCDRPFDNNAECDFNEKINEGEPWFKACQGLWVAGTAMMFILAVCSFCLCCETCRNYTCIFLVTIGMSLAAGALIVTIILYGVKQTESNNDANLFDRDMGERFDWGYYVAIIAACLSIITLVLLCIVICCIKRKK